MCFMGDFNASCAKVVPDNRGLFLTQFICVSNLIAVNTTDVCTGTKHSFVSYDDKFFSLIDYVLLPCEKSYRVSQVEIIDGNCLNVSSHMPIICSLTIAVPTSDSMSLNETGNFNNLQ